MKNLILETMKYCFTGYNQFLICETKTQAKSYLKQNSSINRIKNLKVITDEMRKEILSSFQNLFHTVYDISSGFAVAIEDDRLSCANCADQASIAAPGQTTLCKTHEDEKHFCEMKEFFIKNLSDLRFRPRLFFCSCCGNDSVPYIGIIPNPAFNEPVTFAFCVDCRDELILKQNAARAALERIGA